MQPELLEVSGDDRPLVQRWLGAEHVRRYWGDPEDNQHLLGVAPAAFKSAVIAVDGRKVGLIVWGHPTRRELDIAGLHDVPGSVIDIDIMIGEADATGRGIGSAAIRLVADRALADPTVPYVIAAASVENPASRRAFARAQFVEDREFDDVPYGRHVLMVRRRPGCEENRHG